MPAVTKGKPAEEPVVVRIELPLPLDIAATLISVIGKTYPRTMIAEGAGEHGWRSERRLVLHIDQRDRHKSAKAKAKYQEVKEYADGYEGLLAELGPNGVSVSPHEILVKTWVDLARRTFDMFPDATNYLETVALDSETHDRYVFWVARSEKQTPHELRKQAEARADELQKQLDQLREAHDA